jgi:heptosyltransferase-2/heptosyltransferase-3
LLLTTPALRALRQKHPDAHITALVGPWGAPALARNPNVDTLIELPFPGFTRRSKPSLWQPYRLLWQWRQSLRGQYDTAYVLRFDHWWGALLAYLSDIPQRIGYQTPETAPFLNRIHAYVPYRHEVIQNLTLITRDLANSAAFTENAVTHLAKEYPLQFHLSGRATLWSRRVLQNKQPIAIHPGAGAAIKRWQPECWARVADNLAIRYGTTLLLTGSEAERPLCLEIAGHMTAPVRVMAGQTSLDQLAALFARCRLILGPDSGPLHLATAVATPTVHLYGPVDWKTFGPWGTPKRHRVIASRWPCIPCNRLDYDADALAHHPCVRDICVSTVIEAAEQALGELEDVGSQ